MTKPRMIALAALMLPILALAGLTAMKQQHHRTGVEVTLPVEGFDPRDLLSGHYLQYRVQYGTTVCNESGTARGKPSALPAYVCLEPRSFHDGSLPATCQLAIAGQCQGSQFMAGIERFYIPETQAKELDQAIRNRRGAIVLAITAPTSPRPNQAQVKELLLDGQPWRQVIPSTK